MQNTNTLPNHGLFDVGDGSMIQIEPWKFSGKKRFIEQSIEEYTEIDKHDPDEILFLGSAEIHIYDYGFAHRVYIIDALSGKMLSGLYHGGYRFDEKNQQMMSIMSSFACRPKKG